MIARTRNVCTLVAAGGGISIWALGVAKCIAVVVVVAGSFVLR